MNDHTGIQIRRRWLSDQKSSRSELDTVWIAFHQGGKYKGYPLWRVMALPVKIQIPK